MRNNACKYTGEEEYSCIPYVVKMDRHSIKKNGIREACSIISFVWIVSMAFISQIVIPQDAMADTYSIILMLSVLLQAVGNK